jgi:hypothetical protein
MKGAGSLGHEWFHALDHYFARQDTKAPSERVKNKRGDMVFPEGTPLARMITHGASYKTKLRPDVLKAYEDLMKTMYHKAEQYVEDTKQADKFIATAREHLKSVLDQLRTDLQRDYSSYYKDRPNKKGVKPASAEQLAEFDRLANILLEGGDLETKFKYNVQATEEERKKPINRSAFGKLQAGRYSNDTLDGIGAVYKAVRNRTGFSTDQKGTLDSIRHAMTLYAARLKMFEDAKAGT